MNLNGRSVLLTGATGGIGQVIAEHLHRAGAQLTLTGRRLEVLEPLATRLGATALAADLADPADVTHLADTCAQADVLIANAVLPGSGDILGLGVEEIDRALAVNLRAPMVLSRLLAEQMTARGSGHIVLISSLAGRSAHAGGSLYSATKFGLRGFGQAMRADLKDSGVGVSVVFPGFIRDAGMFHDSGAKLPRFVGTSSPDEVAQAVVHAIEHDRGELTVAPIAMRAGAKFAEVAPATAARVAAKLGGQDVADQLREAQRSAR